MSRYPFPWDLLARLARDLPSGRRSLVQDCVTMIGRMSPRPVVSGMESIPREGPVMIAANHYQRRGLWIGWSGAVIIATVAARRGPEPPPRWLVTGGLRWLQWKERGSEIPFTRVLFRRVADTYGMAPLPLTHPGDRAAVLRAWIRFAEEGGVAGIFPEGTAGRSDALCRPERGFDALCRLVAMKGIPTLPVAVFERDGTLHVRFGQCIPPVRSARAGERVMETIAEMMPEEQRGVYAHGRVT